MNAIQIINLCYVAIYVGFGLFVLRPIPSSYNLLEIKLRLLPFFFKWIGIAIILSSVFIFLIIIEEAVFVRSKEMLFYHINLGIVLVVFSKEYDEDELFKYLRFKSIVVSFINTVIVVGILYPLTFLNNEMTDNWIFDFELILLMFFLYYLIYFYFTKFKMKKELKAKN